MSKTNVLLIHGFGFNSEVWSKDMLRELKERFSVHLFSIPGLGCSYHSLPTFSELAHTIKEKMDPNVTNIIVGHSMGGYIGLEAVVEKSQALSNLILVNSHPFGDNTQQKKKRNQQIQFIRKQGKEKFLQLFYRSFDLPDPKASFRKYASHITDESLIHYITLMRERKNRMDALENLTSLGCIFGLHDPILPIRKACCAVHSDTPSFLSINNGGHLSPITNAKQIIQQIKDIEDYNLSLL